MLIDLCHLEFCIYIQIEKKERQWCSDAHMYSPGLVVINRRFS